MRKKQTKRILKSGCHKGGVMTIYNDRGLHTRPSTELVKCASSFKSQVRLTYQELSANAKSLLGILMLVAVKGAKIKVEAEGEDAEEAVNCILELAKKKFNIDY